LPEIGTGGFLLETELVLQVVLEIEEVDISVICWIIYDTIAIIHDDNLFHIMIQILLLNINTVNLSSSITFLERRTVPPKQCNSIFDIESILCEQRESSVA
jgi:hypothetical protein